jgi:hypothetical protein
VVVPSQLVVRRSTLMGLERGSERPGAQSTAH